MYQSITRHISSFISPASLLRHEVYAKLHAAHNAYCQLVKERTRITNLAKGFWMTFFLSLPRDSGSCGLTALSVLSICPLPEVIAAMTEDEFVNTIRTGHRGLLMKKKLHALHHSARTSIGVKAGAQSVSYELSFLVEKLQLIKRQTCRIDVTLVRLVDEAEDGKYLLSIIGLNYISIAGLLAELGSFRSYRRAKKLQERPVHANPLSGREIVG